MGDNWMPFFRALWWYTTKAAGLVLLGYTASSTLCSLSTFLQAPWALLVPAAAGYFLIRSDAVANWPTAAASAHTHTG